MHVRVRRRSREATFQEEVTGFGYYIVSTEMLAAQYGIAADNAMFDAH